MSESKSVGAAGSAPADNSRAKEGNGLVVLNRDVGMLKAAVGRLLNPNASAANGGNTGGKQKRFRWRADRADKVNYTLMWMMEKLERLEKSIDKTRNDQMVELLERQAAETGKSDRLHGKYLREFYRTWDPILSSPIPSEVKLRHIRTSDLDLENNAISTVALGMMLGRVLVDDEAVSNDVDVTLSGDQLVYVMSSDAQQPRHGLLQALQLLDEPGVDEDGKPIEIKYKNAKDARLNLMRSFRAIEEVDARIEKIRERLMYEHMDEEDRMLGLEVQRYVAKFRKEAGDLEYQVRLFQVPVSWFSEFGKVPAQACGPLVGNVIADDFS